jgi:hypothetical protein
MAIGFYTDKRGRVRPIKASKRKKKARKITKGDRVAWSMNAMEGTEKWMRESPRQRKLARERNKHNWGFEGNSPHTRERKYLERRR